MISSVDGINFMLGFYLLATVAFFVLYAILKS